MPWPHPRLRNGALGATIERVNPLARRWRSAGRRAPTIRVAAVLGALVLLTLTAAAALVGAAVALPPTWGETQRSPGYVLNGRFAGTWQLEPGSAEFAPGRDRWDRIELRVTEDVALLPDAHPGSFHLPDGLVARGTLTHSAGTLPFELHGSWPELHLSTAPPDLRTLRVSIEAKDPGRRDVLHLTAAEGRTTTYRRER